MEDGGLFPCSSYSLFSFTRYKRDQPSLEETCQEMTSNMAHEDLNIARDTLPKHCKQLSLLSKMSLLSMNKNKTHRTL